MGPAVFPDVSLLSTRRAAFGPRAVLGYLAAAVVAVALATSAPFGLALVSLSAAVAVRGGPLLGQVVGWSFLVFQAVGFVSLAAFSGRAELWALAAAAVLALATPRLDPLRSERARRVFSPLAARDGFLFAAVMAVCGSWFLTLAALTAAPRFGILTPLSVGVGSLVVLAVFGVAATLRTKAVGFFATTTAGATALLLAGGLAHRWVRLRLGVPYDPILVTMLALAGGTLSTTWLPLIAARETLAKRAKEEEQTALEGRGPLSFASSTVRRVEGRADLPPALQEEDNQAETQAAGRSLA